MDITVSIPDANVDRVAAAFIGPASFGQEVTADTLADHLTEKFEEQIRQAVQSHEAGQAAAAAAVAVRDAQDPLSTRKADTFASVQEAVAEARAARAIDLIEIGLAVLDEAEVKG